MNGATTEFFNENSGGGLDHAGLLASSTTSTTSAMATNGTTIVNAAELTTEYRLKSGARTTETTLYFDLTNKENFQNGYFDDEPMDVDMSMNAPGTPATSHINHHTNFNRSSSRPTSEVLQISPTNNTNTRCIDPSPNSLLDGSMSKQQHSAVINKPSGPKIIKPIRPAGIVKPVIKPAVARQDESGDGEDIDPFKPRPKLYSGTSSASSISANEGFDEEQHQQQPPVYHHNQPMSDLNTINSVSLSNNHMLNPFQLKSDMLSMPAAPAATSNNKLPSPRSTSSSQNNLGSFGNLSNNEEFNDEWETHKKRSNKSKSSAGNSPQRSQSTRLSGENQHHLNQTSAGKFESMGHVNTGRRSFGDSNGPTDNGVTSNSDGFDSPQLVDFLQPTPPPPTNAEPPVLQEDKESLLFNSIFTNENDFQTFLDLLEKKEVDESKENLQRYSEFARQSLYVQFDPILQKSNLSADKLKRLSLIRDRKEAIKSYLSEINEEGEDNTAPASSHDSKGHDHENNKTKSVFENESKCQRGDNSKQEEVLVAVDDVDERPIVEKKKVMMANDEIAVGGSATAANRFTLDDHDDQLESSHDIDHVISDIKSSSYAADVKHQQRLSMNESSKPASITPDRTSLGKTNGSLNHHVGIERSPSNENANKLLDDFDSSLKLDNNNSIMTTSSYSNKTNDLINRSQYWLEKSNYGKVAGGSEPPAATATNSLTNGAAVNGASSKVVEVTQQPQQQQQQQTSTAPTPSAENYNELVNELNRMKQNEENYQNTIFELKRNQQEFFQIVVDFEEALKTAEQEKVDIEDKLNKEINELTRERDNLQMDVIGLENANKDFQRRFDIVRERIEEFKENEKKLYDALQLSKQQTEKEKVKYAQLRKQAEEKLNSANVEIDKLRNSTSIEIQTLKAELRKAEIKISSMEKSLQQKENENTELTNLLDELLAKVKPPNS